MNILIFGEPSRREEFLHHKQGDHHIVGFDNTHTCDYEEIKIDFYDIITDLNFGDHCQHIDFYQTLKPKLLLLSATKIRLNEVFKNHPVDFVVAGINTHPLFIKQIKEIKLLNPNHAEAFDVFAKQLNWEYRITDDRVGMVTSRVVCMIINEACYALMEGVATAQDIDTAMKLGVNYPYGPFEWCDLIGIKNVYEMMLDLYLDTHDERYKMCPLLKTMYLRNAKFYNTDTVITA
jgi:3-hydroxybutyryl-CoA dehydrogenase